MSYRFKYRELRIHLLLRPVVIDWLIKFVENRAAIEINSAFFTRTLKYLPVLGNDKQALKAKLNKTYPRRVGAFGATVLFYMI